MLIVNDRERVRRCFQEEALKELTASKWFRIGRESAHAYSHHHKWLFRRVETIELVGMRSVRRTVGVDFEVPKSLPKLKNLAAKGTVLVPITVLQKWPPLMDFTLTGPKGHPMSLYLRTTIRCLDFGLLLGMADRTLELGESKRQRDSWEAGRNAARKDERPEPERLSPDLRLQLAALVKDPLPEQTDVAESVNALGDELEERLSSALQKERRKGENQIATEIAKTVDLAARLAGSTILWAPVTGAPRTDRIITFSYLSALSAGMFGTPKENGNSGTRLTRRGRLRDRGKRLLIALSWRTKVVTIPLLHAGRQIRYHLDVRSPEGSVELVEAKAIALAAATADHGHQSAPVRSMTELAELYPGIVTSDQFVGPESGGFYMDYGEPTTLASTRGRRRWFHRLRPRREEPPAEADGESVAEIVDRRAHVYLGFRGAPSHRVFLQVKLAAPRQGFILGCMLAAFAISALTWATYLRLESAALHLEPTVVLLSVVPVVLGYVLLRPGEQALERSLVTGVRVIGVLSGATPIVGALTLVLTHRTGSDLPDLTVAEPIWLALAIFSAIMAACLVASAFVAAPSKEQSDGTDDPTPPPFS